MKTLLSLLFLSSLSHALTPYEPLTAWDRKAITVCWGQEAQKAKTFAVLEKRDFVPYTKDQKKWIRQIVTEEFTAATTGLEFVGWDECPADLGGVDVVLFRYESVVPEDVTGTYSESGGKATVGQKGVLVGHSDGSTSYTSYEKSSDPRLNFVLLNTRSDDKKLDAENYLKLIALHEFGHAAGLRHQHVRIKGVNQDPNCKKVPEIKISEEPAFASTRFAGPYDYNSVMNYCFVNVLAMRSGLAFRAKSAQSDVMLTDPTLFTAKPTRNGKKFDFKVRVGLSEQDKHALRCLYVYGEDRRANECAHAR